MLQNKFYLLKVEIIEDDATPEFQEIDDIRTVMLSIKNVKTVERMTISDKVREAESEVKKVFNTLRGLLL